MSDAFGVDWLTLREPFDHAARAAAVIDVAPWRGSGGQTLQVVDLGCGTGSNLRALAASIGGRQRWCMVDHDPLLLAALPGALAAWAGQQGLRLRRMPDAVLAIEGANDLQIEVETRCVDMARELDAVPFAGVDLVTASALLDLASAAWIDALVARCHAAGAAVHWALTADGRVSWNPTDADDEWVLAQFHAHQRRDKGFGPALGADAGAYAAECLRRTGYCATRVQSDWQVDGGGRTASGPSMLRAMIEGIGGAAAEQAPAMSDRVTRWQRARLAQLPALRLRVGHIDLHGTIV